jgi:3-phenylpropionate/trans-cinnamate dioxygenase ferredoxin subunit
MTWTNVCEFREMAAGMPVAVKLDGDAICVVRAGDDVFAVHDECTHAAVPLSEGEVVGATIECWMHGSKFDLRTGAALNLPATAPVRTYPVRVHDGHVQVSRT